MDRIRDIAPPQGAASRRSYTIQDGGGAEAEQGEGWRARSMWKWRDWGLRQSRQARAPGGADGTGATRAEQTEQEPTRAEQAGQEPPRAEQAGQEPPGRSRRDRSPPWRSRRDRSPPGRSRRDWSPPGRSGRTWSPPGGADGPGAHSRDWDLGNTETHETDRASMAENTKKSSINSGLMIGGFKGS